VNTQCAVLRDGKFLMITRGAAVKHASGVLGFPGGKVDPGDEPESVLESTVRREVFEETGISPSFEDMKNALGLKSKSGIHRHLTSLVERGFVERLPNRARAIRLERRGIEDGVDRRFAGRVDEAAGVHDHRVGPIQVRDQLATLTVEAAEHDLAGDGALRQGVVDDCDAAR